MKRSLLPLLFTILLLFSLVSVHAATEDFVASMDAQFNTCECYPLSKQILITNTGDIDSTYSLYLQGKGAPLAALQTPSFTLAPGQSRYTTLNFASTCQETGNYPFTVLIQTSLGLEKELKSNIGVQKCKTLTVDALSGNQIINNCEEARFVFTLNNVGLQDEIVDISVDESVADRVGLSENPVLLGPQTSKNVALYVATSCEEEGNIPFTASFAAQQSGLEFDHDLNVIIHNRDVPVLGGSITALDVGRAASGAEIPLENTGFDTVTYNIFVTQGPSWVRTEPTTLTIPGYSLSSFTLVTEPPVDAPEGAYDVTVVAQVANTGVTYTKDLVVHLPEPEQVVVEVVEEPVSEEESEFTEAGMFAGLTLSMILVLVGALLLILLLLLLFVVLSKRKKSPRASTPKDSSKGAKQQKATERKLAALEAREKRNLAREQKRAEREQARAEKMMVLEQKRAEKQAQREQMRADKLALREEKRAEKLRQREERQAEKERRKQEKLDAKEAKLQERQQAREDRILAKEQKKHDKQDTKERRLLKNALLKDLRQHYSLVEKEDDFPAELQEEKKPWLWIVLLVLFLILVGAALIWFFYDFVIQYLPFFIVGFIVVIIILILLSVYWNKKERLNRLRATPEGRKLENELKREVTDYYDLIPKRKTIKEEQRQLTDKERKKEEKQAAKEAKKASQQLADESYHQPAQGPRSWRWLWITFLVLLLLAAIAVLVIYQTAFIMLYWPYFLAGIVILIVLILIIDFIRFGNRKKQSWQYLEKGEEAVILVSWRKGLTELYFTVKHTVSNPSLVIKKLKATPLVGLDAEIYQYLEVQKTNIRTQDIDHATFRFRIKKSWLQRENIPQEKVKLYRHTGSKWSAIPTSFVGEDESFMFFEAKTSGFSYFAIGGKPVAQNVYVAEEPEEAKTKPKKAKKKVVAEENAPEEEKSKLWLVWVALAVILLLLIGFVGYKIMSAQESTSSDRVDMPPASTDEAGIPRQVWVMNNDHTLSLGDFFNDPDGDALMYSVEGNNHIDITFDHDVATFTPDQGWTGQEQVIFTADDGEHDPVESNQVRLFVVSQEQYDNQGESNATGSLWLLVVVGIIILVFIIVAIEYARKHREDDEDKEE